jgi:hypothetical protein
MLTLRQFNIGPPVYAHLRDYDVMEDGQSIGRIMEQRELLPGRKWAWYLQITGRTGQASTRPAMPPAWRMPRQLSARR